MWGGRPEKPVDLGVMRQAGRIPLSPPGLFSLASRNNDPSAIETIVAGWPRDFRPDRAVALGFQAETSFREIVDIYVADELG